MVGDRYRLLEDEAVSGEHGMVGGWSGPSRVGHVLHSQNRRRFVQLPGFLAGALLVDLSPLTFAAREAPAEARRWSGP